MITRYKLFYTKRPEVGEPIYRFTYTYSNYGYMIERERLRKLLSGGIIKGLTIQRLGWRGWRVIETW